MAIREKALRYIEEILSIDGKKYKDLQICCIGRLNTQKDSRQFMRNRGERGVDTMRGYFVKHGAICEEIDLNPKGDTVFHYDLGRPITDEKLQNRFDFVLDGGTGEHIDNQFEFYSNIFRIMKIGGVAIQILPVRGFWDGHSTWNYDLEWVYKFANRAK